MSATWMVPSYNTRRWAYNDAPEAGDLVHYMNERVSSKVQVVRWDRVVMMDEMIYRRRGNAGRMWAWIKSHLPTRGTATQLVPVESRKLRPAHYVHIVNL